MLTLNFSGAGGVFDDALAPEIGAHAGLVFQFTCVSRFVGREHFICAGVNVWVVCCCSTCVLCVVWQVLARALD